MYKQSSLVVNWHLTQACNYRCQYCYASWSTPVTKKEILSSPTQAKNLLQQVHSFFCPQNQLNPLAKQLHWDSIRLNFAGGEPLLHTDRLLLIAKQARKLGFKLSIITNGSLLNTNLLSQLAPQLTWLGISIDSLTPATNIAIGRVNSFKKVIDIQELAYQLDHARQVNPSLRIKINTVVNSLNHEETLEKALCELSPNKWKVLRMLPVVNKNLAITDKQFMNFISRHQSFEKILCAEDNKDMCESYLMIDPNGRFFQNSSICPEASYVYSKPILDVGIEAAFDEINFMHKRFHARYSHTTLEDTYEVFL